MKKIIIILGTVLLGVAITVTMIMADSGLKGTAKSVVDKLGTVVDSIINMKL